MKTLDKKHIRMSNKEGKFEFEYDERMSYDYSFFDTEEMFNTKTKERLRYIDLTVKMDEKTGSIYFYPVELEGSNRRIEDYNIVNWFSLSDPEVRNVLDNNMLSDKISQTIDFVGDILSTTGSLLDTMNKEYARLSQKYATTFNKEVTPVTDNTQSFANINGVQIPIKK